MLQRVLFAIVAMAALALACYNAAMPVREGTIAGLTYKDDHLRLAGDIVEVERLSVAERSELLKPRAGKTYEIPVRRAGRDAVVTVTASSDGELTSSQSGRLLDLILAVVYVAFGSLVIARARDTRSLIIAWLTLLLALFNDVADYSVVTTSGVQAGIVRMIVVSVLFYTCSLLIVIAVALLPIGTERLRRALIACSPVLALLNIGSTYLVSNVLLAVPSLAAFPAVWRAFEILSVAYCLVAAAATIVLVHTAPPAERLRVRWFGWSIAIGWYVGCAMWFVSEMFPASPASPIAYAISYYLVSASLAGPIYASLRHRLVDLDIVISRSTVFGVISITLVSAFIVAEWLGGRVADTLIEQGPWRGIASQSVSFALVFAIGLYARHAHARIEERVNAVFFRERTKRLAILASFAHEADIIDSRPALLRLTFEAFSDALRPANVALYVKDDLGFTCAYSTADAAPARLTKDSRLILQLLLRPEPFLSETRDLDQWLIVPLVPRNDVIGFLACGERPDHSAYVNEEIAVIEKVGKHVATSYALLAATPLALKNVGT